MYPRQQGMLPLQEAKRPAIQEPFVGPSSFGSESFALEGRARAHIAEPTVGLSEGTAVGNWLGLTEGFALGLALNEEDGVSLGLAMGVALGLELGVPLGESLGPELGLALARAVGEALGAWLPLGKKLGLFVGTVDSASPTFGESVVPGVGRGVDEPVAPALSHAVLSPEDVSRVGGLVSISLFSILPLSSDSVSVGSTVAENVVARALFTEVG